MKEYSILTATALLGCFIAGVDRVQANEFRTDGDSCVTECYKVGGTNCVMDDFTFSSCCKYDDEYRQNKCT